MVNIMDPLAQIVWGAWHLARAHPWVTLLVCLQACTLLDVLHQSLDEDDKPDPGSELVLVLARIAHLLTAAFFGVATMSAFVIANGHASLLYFHPWLEGPLPAAVVLLVGMVFGLAMSSLYLKTLLMLRNRLMAQIALWRRDRHAARLANAHNGFESTGTGRV